MKKKTYKAIKVNKINEEKLKSQVSDKDIVIGIDVAKEDFFCNLMSSNRETISTIKWHHPSESQQLLELVKSLPVKSVNVVMEPSGTYGDPVRNMFLNSGIQVHRVSPKRTHDAKEVYDGVPSLHDAKSAAIISRLYLDGASEPWSFKETHERDFAALINTLDWSQQQLTQNNNRLEAQLARYWPELSKILKLKSVSLLEMIIEYGSPINISKNATEAFEFIKKIGGGFLKIEKIDAIINSSGTTLGIPMTTCEEEELVSLVKRIRILQKELLVIKKKVEKMSQDYKSVKNISKVVGKTTAAVLVSSAGDPLKFDAPQQYLKSMGLNLKEKSSGKHHGKLSITKRGSNKSRRWLYYTVLRYVKNDEVIKTWYKKKIARDGGLKMKALIAIMRKMVLALWHVARGSEFDSKKLYNIERLGII